MNERRPFHPINTHDSAAAGGRIRVVLADDNASFLYEEARFLQADPELRVVGEASSGAEALSLAHDLRPDLVLMDLDMPGMNGLEATRRIKQLEHPPRVVIVTMHSGAEYVRAAIEVGADGLLPKAELGEKLLPAIHRLSPERKLSGTGVNSPAEAAPLEIFLIEDRPADVRIAREAFAATSLHHHLSVGRHGEEAMAFLRHEGRFAEAPRPDLVLFDLNLSDDRETQAYLEIRRDPALRRIPVVVLVTAVSEEEILGGHDGLGATYCITKPGDFAGFTILARWIAEVWLKPSL